MDPRILYYILPSRTAAEAQNILKRNFATMATHGSLEQIADLAGHWLDDPALLKCAGQMADVARQDWDRTPAAQIALFIDERSVMYQAGEGARRLNKPLLLDSLVDFFHIGASPSQDTRIAPRYTPSRSAPRNPGQLDVSADSAFGPVSTVCIWAAAPVAGPSAGCTTGSVIAVARTGTKIQQNDRIGL